MSIQLLNDYCTYPGTELCRQAKVTRQQGARARKRLEELGYVTRDDHGIKVLKPTANPAVTVAVTPVTVEVTPVTVAVTPIYKTIKTSKTDKDEAPTAVTYSGQQSPARNFVNRATRSPEAETFLKAYGKQPRDWEAFPATRPLPDRTDDRLVRGAVARPPRPLARPNTRRWCHIVPPLRCYGVAGLRAECGTIPLSIQTSKLPQHSALEAALCYNYWVMDGLVTDELSALAARLIAGCRRARVRVSVAESCTGGLVGAVLSAVPGASEVFTGGVLCYQNRLKADLLEVPWEVLEGVGAVSAECAALMAEGVCRVSASRLGLAVTGIAGPGGGSVDKPVGRVYTAVSLDGESVVEENQFAGERAAVRAQSVAKVLAMAIAAVEESES